MIGYSLLELLLLAWGAITFILVGLAIYRSILGLREHDHIFPRGEGIVLQKQRRKTLDRIADVEPWIWGLVWICGGLLLLAAEVWIYEGLIGPIF